jgi:hypothetical protein
MNESNFFLRTMKNCPKTKMEESKHAGPRKGARTGARVSDGRSVTALRLVYYPHPSRVLDAAAESPRILPLLPLLLKPRRALR